MSGQQTNQLVHLSLLRLGVAALDGVGDAVAGVIAQDFALDSGQSGFHR